MPQWQPGVDPEVAGVLRVEPVSQTLLRLDADLDALDRHGALGQAEIHGERHVGGGEIFADSGMQRVGQALAAIVRVEAKAHPAAFLVLLEGFPETLRRRHRTVLVTRAAFLVAGLVDREEDLFRQPCAFLQDGLDDVGRRVGKAGQVVVALVFQNVVEHEKRVGDRCAIGGHVFLRIRLQRAGMPARDRIAVSLSNFDLSLHSKIGN